MDHHQRSTKQTQSSFNSATQTSQKKKMAMDDGRYLSFQLASETYAVPIRTVSEIIGLSVITAVPNLPNYMRGLINLRGAVVPVLDLRVKLSLPETEYTRETCIVIVDIHSRKIGLIVDTVREVIEFKNTMIEKVPDLGGHKHSACLIGLGKLSDRVVIIIEPARILSESEFNGTAIFKTVA